MERRSLRPRAAVDYSAKDGMARTPGWLKTNPAETRAGEPKALEGQLATVSAEKENKRPTGGRGRGRRSSPGGAAQVVNKKGTAGEPTAKKGRKSAPAGAPASNNAAQDAQQPAAKTALHDAEQQPRAVATRSQRVKRVAPDIMEDASSKKKHARVAANKAESGSWPASSQGTQTTTGRVASKGTAKSSEKQEAAAAPPAPEERLASPPKPKLLRKSALKKEEYGILQKKYKEVKERQIEDVENAILDLRAQEEAHSEKARQLAAHWKAEAERQAALAASAVTLHAELAALKRSVVLAQKQSIEVEAKLVEKEEEVADLHFAVVQLQRQLEGSAIQADELLMATDTVPEAEDQGAAACAAATNADRRTAPLPLALREARAGCPEGAGEIAHSNAEACGSPADLAGAAADVAWQEAGTPVVVCNSSAKPLVPYTVGRSVNQQAPKSRFASEAAEAGHAPIDLEPVQAARAAEDQGNEAGESAGLGTDHATRSGAQSNLVTSARGQLSVEKSRAVPRSAMRQPASSSSDAGDTKPLSNVTNKALRNLAGLEASPVPARRDAFVYKHGETGFVFQIGPADPDSDGAVDDLAFLPLALGSAAQVLPPYLTYEIKFRPAQKQKVVGRILEALSKARPAAADLVTA